MSFRVFSAGAPDFQYVRDNVPDEGDFEVADVISAIGSLGPSVGDLASAAAEYAAPNSFLDTVNAGARMEFLHQLASTVNFLAMRPKAPQGWIAVSPRESRTFRTDLSSYARYYFSPGRNPGREFFDDIKGALIDTNLNTYGVLRSLSMVLGRYLSMTRDDDPVMIQIQLSH